MLDHSKKVQKEGGRKPGNKCSRQEEEGTQDDWKGERGGSWALDVEGDGHQWETGTVKAAIPKVPTSLHHLRTEGCPGSLAQAQLLIWTWLMK